MRITNNMMVASTIKNINAAANRLNEASERVATELKISLPSDDPVVATRTIKYRDYVAKIEQYQSNASAATSWQQTTDDALSELYDYVAQIKYDVSKAASGTASESDWADIKEDVLGSLTGIVQTMNADSGGRYIFGGFTVSEEPYALVERMPTNVTATQGSYTAGSLMLSDNELTTGNCSVAVALSGGTYTVTMTDASGNSYSGTTTSVTGQVELTDSSGKTVATLTAPTAGFADGDAFTFTATSCVAVTYKGQYLSTIMATTVADQTVTDLYTGNTYVDSGQDESIKYDLGYGANVTVNTEGQDVVGDATDNLFNSIAKLLIALDGDTSNGTSYKSYDPTTGTVTTSTINPIDQLLDDFTADVERLTTAQAALGARMTYVENVSDRLANDLTNYTTLLSDTIDVDVSKATIEQSNASTVYDAALAVGAKAISKTLVDYMA